MEDEVRVKITRRIMVMPNQTSTVVYEEGWEGTAPRAHIEQIVSAGAGEVVGQHASGNADANAPGGSQNVQGG